MMMGMHFMGDVPFRDVYIHALVRDERARRCPKSKGNVMDPLDLCNSYGTDAVRFTLGGDGGQGRTSSWPKDGSQAIATHHQDLETPRASRR